jgi:hypothetical protein
VVQEPPAENSYAGKQNYGEEQGANTHS